LKYSSQVGIRLEKVPFLPHIRHKPRAESFSEKFFGSFSIIRVVK
jgi:hypothetical protein